MGGRLMQRLKHMMFIIWIVLLGLGLTAAVGQAADVDVFVEGAFTDTTLDVYLYADINGPNLLSFGVKLTYSSPLSVTSAEKNENDWYLGSETYMDPEINSGDVVVIGGKLDPSNPTEGVGGTRTLLGVVKFSHSDPSADFASLLGITYGRGDGTGDYKNFVATDGTVMDDINVSFGAIRVYERGDANADTLVDFQDMLAVRYYTQNGGPDHPWYNCDANDRIDFQDMLCIKAKTQ
jgi:hypothetical protein